jgi:hypothetical protein
MSYLIAIVALAVVLAWKAYNFKTQIPYPPGPPAEPIIGHTRKLPPENLAERYHQLAQVYGAL